MVLADGRIVDCDAEREADLFWALRGAGAAGFGVVTSLAFRTCPAPRTTTFHAVWPARAAASVIAAWQDWAPDGPDELAASLVVTAARDAERPALAAVFGALTGSDGDLGPLLDDLVARVGSDPQRIGREEAPYRAAKARLSELGSTGHGPEDADEGHAYSTSSYVGGRLSPAAIAALAERFAAGRVAGQARELDFSPWGGAYGRVPADATAFVHRSDRFLLKQTATVGTTATREERDAARRWLAASTAEVRPAASGRSYQNFPDPELPDPAAAYYGTNAPRLRADQAAVRPGTAVPARLCTLGPDELADGAEQHGHERVLALGRRERVDGPPAGLPCSGTATTPSPSRAASRSKVTVTHRPAATRAPMASGSVVTKAISRLEAAARHVRTMMPSRLGADHVSSRSSARRSDARPARRMRRRQQRHEVLLEELAPHEAGVLAARVRRVLEAERDVQAAVADRGREALVLTLPACTATPGSSARSRTSASGTRVASALG